MVPGLIEFFLFGIAGGIFQQPIGKSKKSALGSKIGWPPSEAAASP